MPDTQPHNPRPDLLNAKMTSEASRPGRIVLDLGFFRQCYPFYGFDLIWQAAMFLVLSLAFAVLTNMSASQPLLFLVPAACAAFITLIVTILHKRLRTGLYNGCTCPAVVISESPCLVSVLTDMDAGGIGFSPATKDIAAIDRLMSELNADPEAWTNLYHYSALLPQPIKPGFYKMYT